MRDGNIVPMQLSHAWPRMADAARERVASCLAAGCNRECNATTATLTARVAAASAIRVELQCDGCGRSLSGAISRNQIPGWQNFTEWRQNLCEEHAAKWHDAEAAARIARIARTARAGEPPGYLEWCRTSEEWHKLSDRVMWRSRKLCEACLSEPATVVHHLTYAHAWLPPARHLRAVCAACHDRLHADRRGGTDDWCPP